MTPLVTPESVFIGDDFTGASDTLATFARGGVSTKLFLSPPTVSEMAGLHAVGVATGLRSMNPQRMQEDLTRVMPALAASGARFFHYKICSTFDSSPGTGSIGAAVTAISAHIDPALMLILGGQPSLGRYCCFGHLFARAADGAVHRIDRHPVMSRHPVTPMEESDLRRHLAKQGLGDIELVTATELEKGAQANVERLSAVAASGPARLLFDLSSEDHVVTMGKVLRGISVERPILIVGASSVAEALVSSAGSPTSMVPVDHPDATSGLPTFVFAGSRSSVTQSQVESSRLFLRLPLSPAIMSEPDQLRSTIEVARRQLASGGNLLAHLLPEKDYGMSPDQLVDRSAGFVAAVASGIQLSGLGIAGGDTSSTAVTRLGIRSLSYVGDADRGVAICRADTAETPLTLMLKGGQMGSSDLFDRFAGALLKERQAPSHL